MKKYLKSTLLIVLLTLLAGCSTNNLSTSSYKDNIDKNLPTIDAHSLKTISDANAIALEWKGYDSDNVSGYNIYRKLSNSNTNEISKIATLKNKYISHYVDTKLKEETEYLYAMAVVGKNNKHSKLSNFIKAKTLGKIESISFSLAISNLPRQVKILWRPHTNHSVEYYIIQRTDSTKQKWETIKRVKHRLSAEYIDTNLKDNYTYKYRIISVTFNNIVSKPSYPIQATTRALPNSTKEITATNNLAKKIVLKWKNLDDDNIAGYNIFVSTNANMYYKKIGSTKKGDNVFVHNVGKNNATRYYKLASFDKDGLQSDIRTLKAVVGRTIDIPKAPRVTLAVIKGGTVIINWKKSDNRAVSYVVEKSIKKNLFQSDIKVYQGIKNTRFEDSDIKPGVEYKFTVQAVDKDGLLSKKTDPITLSIPEKKVK
jgi:hypothetical protein